ncbi:MAG: 16S rRNA (guanine(527)-N(7))-methyltransferase RsmG [Thermoleophilaceae bacterium]
MLTARDAGGLPRLQSSRGSRAPAPDAGASGLSVSRETVEALAARHGLPGSTAGPLWALLEALQHEPDPPTTLRSPEEAIAGHLADSLSGLAVPELSQAGRIADLGAGAGFPGLALAAAIPAARVDLIESNARKCAVIDRLAAAAGLLGSRSVPHRAEEWAAGDGADAYDAVTARALAPLAVLAEYAAPLLRQGGVLVAWKGARDAQEEAAGRAAAERLGLRAHAVLRVEPFPGARERHLHVLSKVLPTPAGFPRRVGVARKRPLA